VLLLLTSATPTFLHPPSHSLPLPPPQLPHPLKCAGCTRSSSSLSVSLTPAAPPFLYPPPLPTPLQVRRLRTLLRSGALSRSDYERLIDQQVAYAIGVQDALGLDVLVHGEPEVRVQGCWWLGGGG
jgi:hypothetical protein